MTAALLGYEALQRQFRSQPSHLRWLFYMEGVGLLLNNQPQEARTVFEKAEDPLLQPKILPKINSSNFVSLLASVILQKLPQADINKIATTMPPWAATLADFNTGLIELRAQRFTNAVSHFDRFKNATVDDEHKWVYTLQPLVAELARECLFIPKTTAKAEQLYKQGELRPALKALKDVQSQMRIPFLKAQIEHAAADLRQRDDDFRKQQQTERLADGKREREEQQRQKLERQRQQTEADARLLATVEVDAPKLLAAYDFNGLLEKYSLLQSELQTADARARINQHLAVVKALADLKLQLAAAFKRQPINGEDIKQPGGASFIGKLSRASDTQLVFVLDFGDTPREWRKLQPATIVNLAAGYARNDKEQEAFWYMRLAVFCKQYGLDRFVDAYAQLAIKLRPALQEELNKALGK